MKEQMAYTSDDYKTKKDLIAAVKAGKSVAVFQPGPFGPAVKDGPCTLEGPHYPAPHTWYASAVVKGGHVIRVK